MVTNAIGVQGTAVHTMIGSFALVLDTLRDRELSRHQIEGVVNQLMTDYATKAELPTGEKKKFDRFQALFLQRWNDLEESHP